MINTKPAWIEVAPGALAGVALGATAGGLFGGIELHDIQRGLEAGGAAGLIGGLSLGILIRRQHRGPKRPGMNLREFMDQYTDGGGESPLASHAARRLIDLTRNEGHAEALAATLFWQIIQRTQAYGSAVQRAGGSILAALQGEAYVVAHSDRRFDLLVFDPSPRSLKPSSAIIKVNPAEFEAAWAAWRGRRGRDMNELLSNQAPDQPRIQSLFDIISATGPELPLELNEVMQLSVVVAPHPRTVSTSVPLVPTGVLPRLGGSTAGTVGVIATDTYGRMGVTTSLHVLTEAGLTVIPDVTNLWVNGVEGVVRSVDSFSDSCFVEIDPAVCAAGPRGNSGPLSGKSPRQHEHMMYEGMSSRGEAVVASWSSDIPFVFRENQLKVLTDPVTDTGDSGAALYDSEDRVVGFSFYRTGIGVVPEFSAWIWADSVYSVHGLT